MSTVRIMILITKLSFNNVISADNFVININGA